MHTQVIPILNYHQIDVRPPAGTKLRGHIVTPSAFAWQMRLLKALGYKGCSMTELMPYLRGEKTGKVVGITFDDGYLNNLTHALPVLKKMGFSSTCYIVSGLIGQNNAWDVPEGIPEKPLMNDSQISQWLTDGQEIGAHGQQHLKLTTQTTAAAQQEIAQSRLDLQQRFGCAIDHFCYPYGAFDAEHARMAQEAGYASATTMDRGRGLAGDDLYRLRRVPIWARTALPAFWLKLQTRYEDRRGSARQ